MAYITQMELTNAMPLTQIIEAVTDRSNQQTPSEVWDAIQEAVTEEIEGLLAPRYSRPFPDPVHPRLKTAARWITLETLYMRRGLYAEANPATPKADAERKALRDIGTGKVMLDVTGPLPTTPTGTTAAAASTEQMQTKPSGGRLLG